jgi:MoaA/NifB/PqqE/SkfB family radical SAM enzyme
VAARAGGARKLRLLKAYMSGRPVWCSWQVTRRCDALCQFCEHRLEGADPDPALAECLRVAAALDSAGTLVVSLTGGDPLLRDDLPEIVAALSRRHYPLVTTHGWRLSRARARALWQAGLEGASVMLHHADARLHDEAAGLPGSHARALAALEAFGAERTRPAQQVNVKTRLQGGDLDALEGLLRLTRRLAATVTVEPGFPLPEAGPAPADLSARLIELKRRHPHLRSSAGFLGHLPQALREGVPGCLAGRAFLNVDHRGRASQCIEFTRPEDAAGDLRREDLGAVLPRLRERQAANTCRACWYASRGEVEALYTVRGLVGALPALVRA